MPSVDELSLAEVVLSLPVFKRFIQIFSFGFRFQDMSSLLCVVSFFSGRFFE